MKHVLFKMDKHILFKKKKHNFYLAGLFIAAAITDELNTVRSWFWLGCLIITLLPVVLQTLCLLSIVLYQNKTYFLNRSCT